MASQAIQRYLVSAPDPAALAGVIRGIQADPAVELLDTIGPPQLPHTAVVNMSEEQAARLRQRFAAIAGLSVELDQPLSPFDGGA